MDEMTLDAVMDAAVRAERVRGADRMADAVIDALEAVILDLVIDVPLAQLEAARGRAAARLQASETPSGRGWMNGAASHG